MQVKQDDPSNRQSGQTAAVACDHVALTIDGGGSNERERHVTLPPQSTPSSEPSFQRLTSASMVGQSLPASTALSPTTARVSSSTARPMRHALAANQRANGVHYGGILPSFVRMVSSVISNNTQILGRRNDTESSDSVEKFRCFICFDDADVTEAVALSTCGHRYCESCFRSYLGVQINDGHVHPVCFYPLDQEQEDGGQKTCGVAVSDEQIESIVDADVWTKLTRFRFTQQHEHARECPYCSHTQSYAGQSDPTCICTQCERTFCYSHGNAHEGSTCADHELRHAKAEAVNRAAINQLAKPCPGCTRDIEKNGGCNHMKCVVCATNFCWLCSEIIDDTPTPSHFNSSSGSGCSGKQYDSAGDGDDSIPWWAFILGAIAGLLAAPLAFVMTPIVWCFMTGRNIVDVFWMINDQLLDIFGFVIGGVVQIVVTLVEILLVAVGVVLGVVLVVVGGVVCIVVFAMVAAFLFCIECLYPPESTEDPAPESPSQV